MVGRSSRSRGGTLPAWVSLPSHRRVLWPSSDLLAACWKKPKLQTEEALKLMAEHTKDRRRESARRARARKSTYVKTLELDPATRRWVGGRGGAGGRGCASLAGGGPGPGRAGMA